MTNTYDISDYTLHDLRQAFASIDDRKYPHRAVKLYLRIKELEEKQGAQKQRNKTRHKDSILIIVFKFLLYFFLACLFRSNPVFIAFFENDMQIQENRRERVRQILSIASNKNGASINKKKPSL